MAEAGVSPDGKVTAESSPISVRTYPSPTDGDSQGSPRHESGRRTRYPYASLFFLLGNTIGQRYGKPRSRFLHADFVVYSRSIHDYGTCGNYEKGYLILNSQVESKDP